MRMGRLQRRFCLSLLVLFFLPFVTWSGVQSQEAAVVSGEKGGHPKIESALLDLQKKHLFEGREGSRAFAKRRDLRVDEQDKVTVFILPRAGETKEAIDLQALKAYGGEVIKSGQSVIKAKVPILLLVQIADHVGGINFIKQPDRPLGGIVSEGVNLTGASVYQSLGYMGQNVKVAIIDLGFADLSSAISAGVLPATVITLDCSGGTCAPTDFSSEEENHGTAVAEIVHDMAPGAELYLIRVGDSLDLMNAKDYCIANGIRVINHSVGWFISNFYDGACYFDNPVCTANHAYKNGILWSNSMGNQARRHYGATFVDSDGDRLHNVTPDDNFISLYAYEGDAIIALLTWDAWPATAEDYDLLLYDGSKNLVALSTSIQSGRQPPQEEIVYVAPATGIYYLAVRNSSSTTNLRFSLFTFYQNLNPYVATSSLASPADAAGVMAVAAIDYTDWSTGPQESFSSQGPTTDGRMKPEISGPDGVSNFIYGSFFGTSAASPHVAGAAALILSNNPDFTVSQVWNALVSSAIDLGTSGQDPIYGYGRLNLSALFVDPPSIDFGEVVLGNSPERVITIRNIGNPYLAIGAVKAPGLPFTLAGDSCSGKSLPLGGKCTLRILFSPPWTGDFKATLTLRSSDPLGGVIPIPLKGKGVLVVNLSSPADRFPTNPCALSFPPVFVWEVNALMSNYEIQFSPDPGFGSIPVKMKTSGTAYGMPPLQWKKVLSIPGANGGTVYWRVVGSRSDGTTGSSGTRSILIAPPQPVEDASIFPVSQSKLPVLTWKNQCNIKFRVWFGSDAGFSKRVSVFMKVADPNLDGGIFARELMSSQWQGIRNLVGDQSGSRIYWYVESFDELKRRSVSVVKSFVLTN